MIICKWSDISRYESVIPGLQEAVELLNNLSNPEPGTYPMSCGKVLIQAGTTKPLAGGLLEAHRQYLDIQYILEGSEVVGWAKTEELTPDGEFNVEKDAGMYSGDCTPINVPAGYCYVVFPEDAHAPSRHLDVPNNYKKAVVKLKL